MEALLWCHVSGRGEVGGDWGREGEGRVALPCHCGIT